MLFRSFYQMGAIQMYDVVCELFEYSNEMFNTGVEDIDNMYNVLLTTNDPYVLLSEDGLHLTDENGFDLLENEYLMNPIDVSSQNDYFETEGEDFLDFTDRDPFSEIERRA